ncbi:hypothetical protein MYX76_18895, partial [Desulfobacterota bacterium AH_259_B03_O07]|nr:hypothetical protein [Desulfobacterota bacterium AH_259_B03_O07]
VLINFNEEVTEDRLTELREKGIKELKTFYIDNISIVASIRNTILADKVDGTEDAITEIYKKFRPTDPPTQKVAENFFYNMFSNPDTYRLSQVGRLKINYKLNHGISDDVPTLKK